MGGPGSAGSLYRAGSAGDQGRASNVGSQGGAGIAMGQGGADSSGGQGGTASEALIRYLLPLPKIFLGRDSGVAAAISGRDSGMTLGRHDVNSLWLGRLDVKLRLGRTDVKLRLGRTDVKLRLSRTDMKLLLRGYCGFAGLLICKAHNEGCAALASALRSNPSHLRELHLSENKLGDSGVKLLSAGLENPHCKLEILWLYDCGVTDEGCAALASALRSNPSHLRQLILSENKLGDSGVKLLSALLENPLCKLEILRLWDCGVTDEGCAALASALRSNPSHLRNLDLSENNLGDSGVKLLKDLEDDPHYKLKTLGGSRVSDRLSVPVKEQQSQLSQLISEHVSVLFLKPELQLFNEEVLKPEAEDSELTKTIKTTTRSIKEDEVEAVKPRAVAQMLDECQSTSQAPSAFPSSTALEETKEMMLRHQPNCRRRHWQLFHQVLHSVCVYI
ncbi:unnamed protein product [Leuciscus chuanchicus]